MKHCLTFSILFFLIFHTVSAQDLSPNSKFSAIYRISNEEARQIWVKNAKPDTAWLHTLVMVKPAMAVSDLPPGHYLEAHAVGEQIYLNPSSNAGFWPIPLNLQRGLAFTLVDTLGRSIPDAVVYLGKKRIPYDKKVQAYRLKKQKKDGIIEITANGMTAFFEVSWEQEKRYRYRHHNLRSYLRSKKMTRWVFRPIDQIRYWRHAMRYEDGFKDKVKLLFRRRHTYAQYGNFNGYIAFSQPIYKPGDSLHLKAWLTDLHQKPWNQPVTMDIHTNGLGLKSRLLQPQRPGAFVFSMKMTDSLRLDQHYQVQLSARGKYRAKPYHFRKRRINYNIYQSFRYEDYVLDELKYSFTQPQNTYYQGDTLRFRLGAFTTNGQPIPDGQYKLVATAQNLLNFYPDRLYLPDTLWQTTGNMEVSGYTDITLPPSLLPLVDMVLSVQVYCTNSSGELKKQELLATILARRPAIVAKIENGRLYARWDNPSTQTERIRLYLDNGAFDRDTMVYLPFSMPLRPENQTFHFIQKDRTLATVAVSSSGLANGGVQTTGVRVLDTVRFSMTNPLRLPVRCQVFQNQRLVVEQVATDSLWEWQTRNKSSDYRLYCAYMWGGQSNQQTVELPYHEAELTVSLETPAQVLPGETAMLKIKVKDAQNRAVQGADLTAGGYNSRFGERQPYVLPQIPDKQGRQPQTTAPFEINEISPPVMAVPLTERWYETLRLGELPFFQMRHIAPRKDRPGPVSYAFERPIAAQMHPNTLAALKARLRTAVLPDSQAFYLKQPQFSPFVVSQHLAEPIYLIWVDDRLVYYHGATNGAPYSFFGKIGEQTIRLRTRNGTYTLSNVQMKPGKKYWFTISGDGWNGMKSTVIAAENDQTGLFKAASMSWEWCPDELSKQEQTVVRNTMLQLRPNERYGAQYFWNHEANIQTWTPNGSNRNQVEYIGPFEAHQKLTAASALDTALGAFYFDPGFEYELFPKRERLYASLWPKNATNLLPRAAVTALDQMANGIHDIPDRKADAKLQYEYAQLWSPGPRLGDLRLGMPRDTALIGYSLLGEGKVLGLFAPHNVETKGISPGKYKLLVFAQSGQVLRQDIQILPDTLLCLRLKATDFGPPQKGEALQDLFNPKPLPETKIEYKPIAPGGPGWGYGTVLSGRITDMQEALIGASVKVYWNGNLVRGCITDWDGHYLLSLEPGTYDVEVLYTGYTTQKYERVQVLQGQNNLLNVVMSESAALQEVVVVAYKLPMVKQDNITAILSGRVPGVQTSDVSIKIKGSRNDGTAHYADGIRVSGLKDLADAFDTGTLPPDAVRSNFKDLAYFRPLLSTDDRGEALFQVQFPDDITAWNQYAIAADSKGRAGFAQARTRAQKQVTGQLSVPRFAVAGDRFDLAGRTTNASGDSLLVRTRFLFNQQILNTKTARIGYGMAEFQSVSIPNSTDSVTFGYEVQSERERDGEQRVLPVLPIGVEESNGFFAILKKDTTLQWDFAANGGTITIQAQDNALSVLLQDLEYLRFYPYGCNEQTASRLVALLLLKNIKAMQKAPLDLDKEIMACIKRLQNAQNRDASWGWWANDRFQPWMSQYVLHALFKAQDAGYKVQGLESALDMFRIQLPRLSWYDQVNTLLLLKKHNSDVDCTPYLAKADSLAQAEQRTSMTSGYATLDRLRLRQACGQPLSPGDLRPLLQPTFFGGLYVGEQNQHWYERRYNTTLMAFDIAQKAGWEGITDSIAAYWLHSRKTIVNTFEKAQVLERILPVLLRQNDTLTPIGLQVNDQLHRAFPVSLRLSAQAPLEITKTGNTPLYLTAYQTHHNPTPAPRSDQYAVSTRLLRSNGTPSGTLTYGESATLEVTVEAAATSDYVMIEVPIPAGCTYGPKAQPAYRSSPEVHREYFKDRTAIFCTRLPKGTHVFRIPLESRFTGKFTLNPTKVEQMYFPLFYGRNGVQVVEVR